jgi:hypothetical protein
VQRLAPETEFIEEGFLSTLDLHKQDRPAGMAD